MGLATLTDIVRQPANLVGHAALELLHRRLPLWLEGPETRGAVLDQIRLLSLDFVPPTVVSSLGGDLVAIVMATQESHEVCAPRREAGRLPSGCLFESGRQGTGASQRPARRCCGMIG